LSVPPRHTLSTPCRKTASDRKRPARPLSHNISPRCSDRPCSTPRNTRRSVCETSHHRWLFVGHVPQRTSADRQKRQSVRKVSSDSPACLCAPPILEFPASVPLKVKFCGSNKAWLSRVKVP